MIFQIKNLSFNYPNSNLLLDNVSFNVETNKSYTILGKNGVGKTTLLKCMLNEINNYQGEILLNNKNIKTLKEKELAKLVSYVPSNVDSTFDYTVFEYVLMGTASNISLFSSPSKKEYELTDNALQKLNIFDLKDRRFSTLSAGEKQKAAVARAIVNKPSIILFDEPCSHLDINGQIQILKIINELIESNYSIILTTHDPNHALILNNNVMLFKGSGIIEIGETKDILNEEKLQEIYGKEIKIRYLEEFKRNIIVYPSLQ